MSIEDAMKEIREALNGVSEIVTDIRIKQARHEETQKNTNKSIEELKESIINKFKDSDFKLEKHKETQNVINKSQQDKIDNIDAKVDAQSKFTQRIIIISGGIGSLITLIIKEAPLIVQKILN